MLIPDERLADEIFFAYMRLEQELNNIAGNGIDRLGEAAMEPLRIAIGDVLGEFGDRILRPAAKEHPASARRYGAIE